MQYELDVERFLLTNYMMDMILLSLVQILAKGRGKKWPWKRIGLAALEGSVGSLLVLVFPLYNFFPVVKTVIRFTMIHGIVNTGMLVILLGFKGESEGAYYRMLLKGYTTLYLGSFLLGGVLTMVSAYVDLSRIGVFFVVTILSYQVILALMRWYDRNRSRINWEGQVKLYIEDGISMELKGLLDTGNGLTDPITGKPVSILSRETARKYLSQWKPKHLRYIPYHTVSGDGVMPVFEAEKMMVIFGSLEAKEEREAVYSSPLIGIETASHQSHTYEIILSQKLV